MKRFGALGLVLFLLAACSDAPIASPVRAPSSSSNFATGTSIAGRYIVVFKGEVQDAEVDGEVGRLSARYGAAVRHTYKAALKGMAIELSDAKVAALRAEPSVAYVEQDQVMSINTTQSGATWGIDRIDQRALPLSGTYTYGADGTGVTVYIIDTGINFTRA